MNNPVLQLQDICKTYHQGAETLEVLKSATLHMAPGQVAGLLGHSGSGKTTLLHIAGLLDVPTSGSVIIDGQDTAQLSDRQRTRLRGQKLGFVYQFHHLLPEFSALENVMMPMIIARAGKRTAAQRAMELIEAVGLADRAQHRPSELSGGEKQRIAIARALVNRPAVLLADEPTGNLDDANAKAVLDLLLGLAREQNMAALIVTHNQELAARLDDIWRLKSGVLSHG